MSITYSKSKFCIFVGSFAIFKSFYTFLVIGSRKFKFNRDGSGGEPQIEEDHFLDRAPHVAADRGGSPPRPSSLLSLPGSASPQRWHASCHVSDATLPQFHLLPLPIPGILVIGWMCGSWWSVTAGSYSIYTNSGLYWIGLTDNAKN